MSRSQRDGVPADQTGLHHLFECRGESLRARQWPTCRPSPPQPQRAHTPALARVACREGQHSDLGRDASEVGGAAARNNPLLAPRLGPLPPWRPPRPRRCRDSTGAGAGAGPGGCRSRAAASGSAGRRGWREWGRRRRDDHCAVCGAGQCDRGAAHVRAHPWREDADGGGAAGGDARDDAPGRGQCDLAQD